MSVCSSVREGCSCFAAEQQATIKARTTQLDMCCSRAALEEGNTPCIRRNKQLFKARLPAAGYATPATYSVDGKQYVVIPAGGGKMGTKPGDAYVAFSLP